LKYQLVS